MDDTTCQRGLLGVVGVGWGGDEAAGTQIPGGSAATLQLLGCAATLPAKAMLLPGAPQPAPPASPASAPHQYAEVEAAELVPRQRVGAAAHHNRPRLVHLHHLWERVIGGWVGEWVGGGWRAVCSVLSPLPAGQMASPSASPARRRTCSSPKPQPHT